MISILLPTRKRPKQLERMIRSARQTSFNPVEIVVYVDNDDRPSIDVCIELETTYLIGPRILLTETWNECFKDASGDIFLQGNDDICFLTEGWDLQVEMAFEMVPDKILMVHGDDGGGLYNGTFGPHPFVHRRWIETLGYFIAPFFSSDYGDTWLNDVADMLGRRKYLPFTIEHMHMAYGKAEVDETTEDRLRNHKLDGVDQLYRDLLWKRERDAEKLRKLMIPGIDTKGWAPPRPNTVPSPCPRCKSKSTVYSNRIKWCNACGNSGWE